MTVDQWFNSHNDVEFEITYPRTRSGHKTDIEMYSLKSGFRAFRESITYAGITEERVCEILDDMYKDIMAREKMKGVTDDSRNQIKGREGGQS